SSLHVLCFSVSCVLFFPHLPLPFSLFFFFNSPPTTEIYTLSLHDALPIYRRQVRSAAARQRDRKFHQGRAACAGAHRRHQAVRRSEEHTSELQSQSNLVCRLLLEKKKKTKHNNKIEV